MLDKNEKVLCIKRDHLPKQWVSQKSIVSLDLDTFIKNCSASGFEFVKRMDAENDSSYKQIIPYIILQTKDHGKTAIYQRQGSEQRLHDLWSLGIGGHINPIDMNTQKDSFKQILMQGMQRELDEELEKMPGEISPEFVGVISEDITDVGRVHLGAVFTITAANPENFLPGEELFQFKWAKTNGLYALNLELWSTMALDLIKK
ncbi:MAG: phosphoesterase [Desulfobacula sp.]|nr:phosphoesterase [Desulfobacula sp.]